VQNKKAASMAKNYRVAAGKYIHASVCVYVYTPFKIETHTKKQREKREKPIGKRKQRRSSSNL
jgi:hypothetical protein